jgi:hypothetical protein
MRTILRVIKLCYEHAYLGARRQAGLALGRAGEVRLSSLRQLWDSEAADPRRRHRRIPVALPALLKTPSGLQQATVLNIGGGGLFVVTGEPLDVGTPVQVRMGRSDSAEYSFPCSVQWTSQHGLVHSAGLRLVGTPLEMRHGQPAQAAG